MTIFLAFLLVFSMDFVGLFVFMQLFVYYTDDNVIKHANNNVHIQFDSDKQEYNINVL